MKKTIMLALLVMAVSAYGVTPDKKKKKKKNEPEKVEEVVKLASTADTLSYSAGMASTRGLVEFIQKEYGVDTAYMADFEEGFMDALVSLDNPKYVARNAGAQIARMVKERILPQTKQQYEGMEHTVMDQMFHKGFMAAVKGDTSIMTLRSAQETYSQMHESAMARKQEAYKSENEAWLNENASKDGVQTTSSGLQYKVLVAGTGEMPKVTDEVTVKYEGRLIDGTEFDSSYKRNPQTTTFRPDQVIKGWTEALTMMPVGSKWELYIPQELGYGARQAGKIKPYSTLVFTVELVDIKKQEAEAGEAADAAVDGDGANPESAKPSTVKPARLVKAKASGKK